MKRFVTIIALATASTVACAREAAMQTVFDDLDADNDGYLNAKEIQVSADLKLKLEHIDSDGDGKVSREEFVAAFEKGSPSGPAGPTAR